MVTMPLLHGVDTSNNQGAGVVGIGPDIVNLGAPGWWHKATQGQKFRDPYWPVCRQARIDVGLRYGGPYHWPSPGTSVPNQFKNFRDFVGGLTTGEAIQLDLEDPAGLSDAEVIQTIELWEDEWPGRVVHYMGRFYMRQGNTYMVDRMLARFGETFRWWLPWYTSTYPAGQLPVTPVVWQWAGGASGVVIPSLGRRVDSNQIIDVARLDAISGYGGPRPPQPPGGTMEYMLWPVDGMNVVFYGAFDGRYGHLVEPLDEGRIALYRSIGIKEMPSRTREQFTNLVCVGPPPPGFERGHFRQVLDGGAGVNTQAIVEATIAQVIARLGNG